MGLIYFLLAVGTVAAAMLVYLLVKHRDMFFRR